MIDDYKTLNNEKLNKLIEDLIFELKARQISLDIDDLDEWDDEKFYKDIERTKKYKYKLILDDEIDDGWVKE